ncbi:unnamed protein product [Symbiodinium microadriaticum]|nr:unnamed protein product [Symbiodinium microadriaticum]CAE7907592.1 unnamed protein product [Symbiodinium sp. KB8]
MFRALQDRLRELMALHPDGLQGVLLEQVPGLLKSKDAWDTWSTGLLECLPGFVMFTATLNSLDFMVPQSRKRLYIVLLRASSMMQPYVWPQPTGQVTLASILQTEAEAKEDKKHKGIGAMKKKTKKSAGPCTTAKQKERLKRQLQCLRTARYNPNSILAAIDIDSGWKGRRWRIGYTPTITRSRGGSGGSLRSTAGLGIVSRPYLTTRHRRTTPRELAALQGLNYGQYELKGISARQFGQMVGNAMTKTVLVQIWRQILICQGVLPKPRTE